MDASDLEESDVLGSLGSDALKVVGALGVILFAPLLLLLLSAFGGLPQATRTTAAPAAISEIPPDQLAVMQQVSLQTGIPWQVLAAISKVESDFGRNMAVSSAGAVGYCQFMPATWAAYGMDGNGDGLADPYDFRDCIPAMGRYLMANGAPADLLRAIYAYNHSWAYVDKVLAWAAAYGYVDPASIAARAVGLARSRIGAPYVWGATGPNAFDCSGLVLWVYGQLGLHVPRTAQQQFEWAVPINPSQLQPGDLTFYQGTYSPSPDRITHVGIYTGGATVVMATTSGDFVREVSLSDPYWSAHLASAGPPALLGGPGMMAGRGAMLALVGFAGLLLVMAVVSGWQGTARLTSRGDETEAVEEAARSFVEAYGTFDFRDPASYRNRLLALTTASVREAITASQVDPVALGQQRTISSRVTGVQVSALSNDEATASVTAEQLRHSVEAASGRLLEERVRQRVACRLVREGGRWLVSEFRLVSEEPASQSTELRKGEEIHMAEINTLFNNLLNIGLGVGVAVSSFFVMWGAFLYMSAAGSPHQMERGKAAIVNALAGLAIVLMARVIAGMIQSSMGA